MLSVALFAAIVTIFMGVFLYGQASSVTAGAYGRARLLSIEGLDAVANIADSAWNELDVVSSGLSTVSGVWTFEGEATSDTTDIFSRTIVLENVCRDIAGAIASCPAERGDIHTKLLTSNISWQSANSPLRSVSHSRYITNWLSQNWTQTDWSGGDGQAIWTNPALYDNQDGNLDTSHAGFITLATTNSNCGQKLWPLTTPANYTYDPSKIEVSGGTAHLVSGSTLVQGDLQNSGFTTSASPWTYTDWEDGGNVNGAYQSSGGNPGGYVNITIAGAKNRTISGYWEQSFSTTVDNPSVANLNLDYSILQFSSSNLTSYRLYVFVDAAPGAPTIGAEVWASPEITGTSGWSAIPSVDISGSLGAQGTYYVKVAARAITGGGPGSPGAKVAGFDNVAVHWEENAIGYPTDRPTINPILPFSVSGISNWASFTETANKGGGEVYYQLSDDNGSTWQYWDGIGWSAAGASDYNTAAVVDANIASFPIVNEQITWRAFLESDGSEQVEVDEVSVEFQVAVDQYVSQGYLISSAFDTSDTSAIQAIDWSELTASCQPTCYIRFQIQSAPDNTGAPGAWTANWSGPDGDDGDDTDYFSAADGQLINTDHNGDQWVRYRVELIGDGTATPALFESRINYK